MRTTLVRLSSLALLLGAASSVAAQTPDLYSGMRWRQIGPTRAGRARAIAGVPSQPNVFYAGFDNGGVWRSTDYGSNWVPLFDDQPTGSIGAIAVAQSNPNIIYVGTGAGIIRPDLATGDGMYKSTDAGKTWTHLGLRSSQMIAMIDVDPRNPDRLFVAVLGHPYGPNEERGIFRSTDGGRTFEKVLYKDEYTSGNDVRIDPVNPNNVYAVLWQQQESYQEGASFGGASGGIFKSTDGGTTWKQLTEGLPLVQQANLGISLSNPGTLYATIAAAATPNANPAGGRGGRGGGVGAGRGGAIGLYKTTDGGEHWVVVNPNPNANPPINDNRPLGRIGGGDLPTLAVDPKNPDVLYACSTVFWRSEDGGVTWSAVRGAPGGDDYQKAWVSPASSDIVFVVSDQGAVVSANRGVSWSNWYTQPTAAMYHVSVDNDFPYNVCSGQQDSGSACVSSRGMDGQITFHDWHPVNIQEYGEAAPDPKDPNMVYGSQRQGVSLYNKKTAQTTSVGPDMTGGRGRGAGAPGTGAPVAGAAPAPAYNRNVRTQPLEWSPVDNNTLFYASNVVWKTTDRAHTWTRISPDLARQTWEVPANAGKYGATVTPAPLGTITALSPSPKSLAVLWAGTDDGYVQVTMDGGAHWSNVTPPSIKAWTRIYNLDAGHFDTKTAYIAANTLRLDDMNPHFFRTHDGGKTWTEINNGILPGAASTSIREDPRKPGLLYAATETQVWVSFDDGDHWSSLRLNMPAISVRDIEVKDDSTCMCSDLVAGTHGRGFWILDAITPLRQMADAQAAKSNRSAVLFKPVTAVRVRVNTNDPTPWPPEVPAGENPPPGAVIDYYLGADAAGPVTLEILDAAGKLVRSYTSRDTVRNPDPARDPVAYNEICKRNPGAPDCGLPLYWPAPSVALSNKAGMHRFTWEIKYDPAGGGGGRGGGGAVPHRTYAGISAPWAPPGNYTVKLTVDGKSYTQPIAVKLDPRVKTSPIVLAQLNNYTVQAREAVSAARAATAEVHALSDAVGKLSDADAQAFKAKVDSFAPAAAAAPGGAGGRGGRGAGGAAGGGAAGAAAATMESAANAMLAAAMATQSAEVAPTANQVAAFTRAQADYKAAAAKWNALRTTGVAAFNAKRKAKGLPTVSKP